MHHLQTARREQGGGGVARTFDGKHATLERQRESTESGKQIGNRPRVTDRAAYGVDQCGLPVPGRLEERALRHADGDARKRYRRLDRRPSRLRPDPVVDRQPREAMFASECVERFGSVKTLRDRSCNCKVDALIDAGERDRCALPIGKYVLQQAAQRCDEREQFRKQDVAFTQVNDVVALRLVEAENDRIAAPFGTQAGAAARARR